MSIACTHIAISLCAVLSHSIPNHCSVLYIHTHFPSSLEEHAFSSKMQSPIARVHAMCGVLHVVSSVVLTGLLASDAEWHAQATSTYAVRNDHDQTSVKVRFLESFMPAWLLVGAGLVSGVSHLFLVNMSEYDLNMIYHSGVNPVRWVDYAVSSSMMLVVIGSLSGVTNEWIMVQTCALQATLMLVSCLVEKHNDDPSIVVYYALACALHVVGVWAPIFDALSYNNPPYFVYGIMIGIVAAYALFGVIFALVWFAHWSAEWGETAYAAASVTAKVLLQWTLYGGVVAASGNASALVGGITAGAFFLGMIVVVVSNGILGRGGFCF
jgi:hypothetical protein